MISSHPPKHPQFDILIHPPFTNFDVDLNTTI